MPRDHGRPSPPEVYSITGAQRSRQAEMQGRMTKYVVSMTIRTVCFVLAVVISDWERWLFAVGAIVLPYVAVLIANAGREKPPQRRPGTATPAPRPPQEQPAEAPPAALTPPTVVRGETVTPPFASPAPHGASVPRAQPVEDDDAPVVVVPGEAGPGWADRAAS